MTNKAQIHEFNEKVKLMKFLSVKPEFSNFVSFRGVEGNECKVSAQYLGHRKCQGSKCWVPGFPQALHIFHGNSTLHLEFPMGNPAKNAGNLSYAWGIKV